MRVWQVAAGDKGRDNAFPELFLKHDVMLLGPGNPGDVRKPESDYSRFKPGKVSVLKRFANDVKPGDYVILRLGTRALSVGIVADEDYDWDMRFSDVNGWALQHVRRVCWQKDAPSKLDKLQTKKNFFAPRGAMISRVNDPGRLKRLGPILEACKPRKLKPLPDHLGDPLSDDEVGELLFSRGLSQGRVDSLIDTIGRQRRMLRWYDEHGLESGRPTEHEVVAYMVLPILLSLGWSEQLLAVEWKNIDLAAFSQTPTTPSDCVMVCEAKGRRSSLQERTLKQAVGYVSKKKLTTCRHVLLTQGHRFYLYKSDKNGNWPEQPTGYLNLAQLRTHYLVPDGANAIDTLMAMTPQAILGGQGL